MNGNESVSPMTPETAHLHPTAATGDEGTPARRSWIGERFGTSSLDYAIPPAANRLRYMLGGLTFFGILILIVTGIFLDQFYNPSPVGAHDSILYIMTRVRLGNWVRALHYWAATLVFVSVFLHLVFVFWRRSYSRPREVTWWAGVGLAVLIFVLIFTGTVLRGDQEGTEALEHAVAGGKMAGPPGAVISPDFAASTSLLARLHNLHVSVLPLLLIGLIGLHFALIRIHGIHSHQPKTARFSQHARRLTGFALLLFAGIGVLAAVFPPGIGHPGIEGVEVTKPFWPFLWIYAVENTVGMTGMLFAPVILFGFLFAVPLLDRGNHETTVRPRWLTAAAVLMLVLYIGGIAYGVIAPQKEHMGM